MSAAHKQFVVALKGMAEEALRPLSEKERVHFALKVLVGVTLSSILRIDCRAVDEHQSDPQMST